MSDQRNNGGGALVPAPRGGQITTRSEAGDLEALPIVETATAQLAAAEEARVKARALVAINRPRDMLTVRARLLAECARPGFAAVARYSLPRGGKSIQGPTIRFAEAAARVMGNLEVSAAVIYDDTAKRLIRVTVTDLESNHSESADVTVEKVMERRQIKPGETAIGRRINSQGEPVYIVAVPESEMPVRQGAAVAKVRRNLILAHLPGDILEEAQDAAKATAARADAADPAAAIKRLADAFAGLGVLPDQLRAYLGCDLGAASPSQIEELRGIFAAIREGAATWRDVAQAAAGGDAEADKLKAKIAEERKRARGAKPDAAKPAASAAAATSSGKPASAAKEAQPAASASAAGPQPCARCKGTDDGVAWNGDAWAHPADDARCQIAPPHDPATGEVLPAAEPREPGAEG